MKLYLDDKRDCPEGWTFARTVNECMAILATGSVKELSLDHDLGPKQDDGYEVLRIMERAVFQGKFIPPMRIRIHSANAGARTKMEHAAQNIVKKAHGIDNTP